MSTTDDEEFDPIWGRWGHDPSPEEVDSVFGKIFTVCAVILIIFILSWFVLPSPKPRTDRLPVDSIIQYVCPDGHKITIPNLASRTIQAAKEECTKRSAL